MMSASDTSTLAGNAGTFTKPPPIHYSIRTTTRERKIILFFTLLFLEAGVLPLILFFSIRWGAHLSNTKNLAIITSIIGTYTGYKLAMRMYRLWISDGHHQRRPIGAGRWGVDAFTIMIHLAETAFFAPLIVGSSLNPASVKIVDMAIPLFMITLCFPMLISGLFPHRIRVPFRVSSLPAYEGLPPATYTLVEDVVAVDGGGCIEFRQAWRIRYEHSAVMRRILRVTSIAWGASGTIVAAALIAVAWTTTDDIGYGCAYGLPWLWAIIFAAWTVHWVKGELRREERDWHLESVHNVMTLHIRQTSDPEKMATEQVKRESV
ncbi:hypothetical protein JAAARDRAFT_670663 [Jaapia argillacea MUCL 33604]|uniref:Uncharacterized protein n=1 Tax=Jaapia argillacea MUCL 33604 TaxID=933084 RepID=A0A067PXB2_9AGAM|nr:hypothetical protein JAAARDRAFT_670663 [Jaapia argillacea MUCL 33604]